MMSMPGSPAKSNSKGSDEAGAALPLQAKLCTL